MMRKLLVLSIGLAVSTMIAYGDGEGDVSLERVKANFVRVLRDTNAIVYSEIAKMGGVPPVADSNIRTVAESGGVSEKHVERLIREQRADGSWPSVDYTSALRSQWPANEHLSISLPWRTSVASTAVLPIAWCNLAPSTCTWA